MIDRLKQETGSALVLAVMVTTVVITLITLVVTMAMMMTTQSHATAKIISGDTLAESGITYYELYVEHAVAGVSSIDDVSETELTAIESETIEASAGSAEFSIDDIQMVKQDASTLAIYYTVNSMVTGRNDTPLETSKDAEIILDFN